MNWQKESNNLKGATIFTLQAMLCIYVIIAFAAALTGNQVPPPQSWAGFTAVIGGIASAGVKHVISSHKKAMGA